MLTPILILSHFLSSKEVNCDKAIAIRAGFKSCYPASVDAGNKVTQETRSRIVPIVSVHLRQTDTFSGEVTLSKLLWLPILKKRLLK